MQRDNHLRGGIATERAMKTFLARLPPVMLDRIVYDCGLTEDADKLATVVAFCLSHGITVMDLRVRYPELASLLCP